jgi:Domain of unknown function (DUF222)
VSAAPRRESQEEILEAALASLTDEDIPPADDELDGWPDPDFDRPAELAGLDGSELEELAAKISGPSVPAWPLSFQAPAGTRAWPAGFGPRGRSGDGPGFADGGVLDVLAAGLTLAGFAAGAQDRLSQVTDDELVGVLRAWRRVTSWAAASELAAVAELARRRPADGSPPAAPGRLPLNLSEFVPDEVAAALTLTGRTAQDEVNLALDLAGPLADTWSALSAGRIDLAKAKIIAAGVATLTAAHAAAVQAAVLPEAPDLTTGQLGRAVARAVLAADPAAADRQREEDLQHARVDCWPDPAGTAGLAGYHLPAAAVLAADARLTRIARLWRKQGAGGGMDLLRAWAYLALLLGQDTGAPPPCLLPADPPAAAPGPHGAPDGDPRPSTHPGDRPGPGPDEAPAGVAGTTGHGTPSTTADGPGTADAAGAGAADGPGTADNAGAGAGAADGPGTVDGPGTADGSGTADGPGTADNAGAGAETADGPGTADNAGFADYAGTADRAGTAADQARTAADQARTAADGAPVSAGLHRAAAGAAHAGLPPLAGSVNLTIPLATLVGLSQTPGAAAGYGPLDAGTARALACAAAGHRATRWHVTVTGPAGRALGHGTARAVAAADGGDWTVAVTAEPLAAGRCDHRTAEPGYRPSPALQRLVRGRTASCSWPGCGRPAAGCDLDHTIPHDKDGLTCECNLAPLCRWHHRCKQAEGWRLEQPAPGVMAWHTPAGRRYITLPSQHPG